MKCLIVDVLTIILLPFMVILTAIIVAAVVTWATASSLWQLMVNRARKTKSRPSDRLRGGGRGV